TQPYYNKIPNAPTGQYNPAHRNAVGLGSYLISNALKGQYKINCRVCCPFRAMDIGKNRTRRVAAGWGMLPLAGRSETQNPK
ncbi:MAG: hypothetical protein LBQ66_14140, partial [Planctomycetaceae bacterium]|nr:hypothetical protein [Planctomycetaceae bacterium]